MKGGMTNCRMCEKGIKTVLKTIGAGSRRGYIDSKEGISFENIWFCNKCWSEIVGEKIDKPFKTIKKKLPHKKPRVFRIKDKIEISGKPICMIEVKENIKRVFKNKPLTRPLAMLNRSCEFKKRYDIAFDTRNGDKINELKRIVNEEYNSRPETKEKRNEYYRRYQRKPAVKERMKEYRKRPEVKEKKISA